ncbi:MAG TPA: aldehyde dehydrogenase family protein, partial [Roseiflexaceae bacterium]|nr:aldehyde dehydrogenase family protein [Roseiflexaceae bacterium]
MAQTDTPEYKFLLAGEWRDGKPYTVTCPFDDAPVGRVARAGAADLEQAISAAVAAFETTRKLPAHARSAALRKISAAIADQSED